MQYLDAEMDQLGFATPEAEDAEESSVRHWHYEPAPCSDQLSPQQIDVALARAAASLRPLNTGAAFALDSEHPHVKFQREPVSLPGDALKRILDVVGALALIVALSPLLLVVGLALLRDHGPIIYGHTRTGRYGRSFTCLKFRTMVPNSDQVLRDLLHSDPALKLEWMRDHKLRNDPRITTIGRFLRRTSLDELPQLLNVLKGEMSLVGPRPVVSDELQRYGRRLSEYLTARPGITGLWQVMGRSDTCYRRRVALDTYYVRKRNVFLDVYILLRTIKVVLRGNGAC